MDKAPEFKDKWILAWFAFWFLLFLPLAMSTVPETHGAYWREVLIVPLSISFLFTGLAGLARPAGWLSVAGLLAVGQIVPELGSPHLYACFWVMAYFTLFFSPGERLTLGKILKVAVINAALLTFAHFLDPSGDRHGSAETILNWLVLLGLLVCGNGLMRLGKPLVKS